MAIVQTPQRWIRNIIVIGLFAVLTACGGGGDGNDGPDNPPPADTTPNAFSFTATDNAELGEEAVSNSVTVRGINAAATISISGGEYSIAAGNYISSASTITNGQSVTVRVTTPETGDTPVEAVLTIGGVGATFTVTTRPNDTTPDAFSFAAITNAQTNTSVTSAAVTIAGINTATAISITGGEYAIDDEAFTSAGGTITNNQTVTLKITSSEMTNTPATAVLTVGGVTGNFSVTTAPDTTPDNFSFVPVENVAPDSVQTSNTITVSGIDIAVPISITAGEYAIDEGEYTTAPGMVSEGQSINVKATTASTLETTTESILTIGGVTGNYAITTFADEIAPTAEFMFPPPASMTEGNTIRVRGKVTDDYSEIESAQITVNNNPPQVLALTANEDGSASWQIEVTLEAGENTLIISTEDAAGNPKANAAQVNVRQDVTLGSFPDAENPLSIPKVAVIDRLNGRNRLLVTDTRSAIYEIDLDTAQRNLVTDFSGLGIDSIVDILLDQPNNRILVRDHGSMIVSIDLNNPTQIITQHIPSLGGGYAFVFNDTDELKLIATNGTNGNVLNVSLDFTSVEIFSDNTNPEQGVTIPETRGIAFDKDNQRYFLASYSDQTIYAVDSVTGVRNVFSRNGVVGGGDDFGAVGATALARIAVDESNQRVIVSENGSGKMFSIDMDTGDRTILTSSTVPNSFNPMLWNYGFVIDNPDSYAYVCDELNNEIFAVDLVTGHRVYFSKN